MFVLPKFMLQAVPPKFDAGGTVFGNPGLAKGLFTSQHFEKEGVGYLRVGLTFGSLHQLTYKVGH